ncbi:hypothetical protein QQP08_010678 [Theobroma cacao]|nr:hypothetical protein QQP08_010678 [Theobroma cacao]
MNTLNHCNSLCICRAAPDICELPRQSRNPTNEANNFLLTVYGCNHEYVSTMIVSERHYIWIGFARLNYKLRYPELGSSNHCVPHCTLEDLCFIKSRYIFGNPA